MRSLMLLLGLMLAGCGGVSVVEVPDPEEFSGKVTKGGQPISDVTLRFQPIEKGGTEAIVPVKDGKYTATATKGKYTFFFEEAKNPVAFQAIPDAYKHGSEDRAVEVTGEDLDLTIE